MVIFRRVHFSGHLLVTLQQVEKLQSDSESSSKSASELILQISSIPMVIFRRVHFSGHLLVTLQQVEKLQSDSESSSKSASELILQISSIPKIGRASCRERV